MIFEVRVQKRVPRRVKKLLKRGGFYRVRKTLWRMYQTDTCGYVYETYFGNEISDVMVIYQTHARASAQG